VYACVKNFHPLINPLVETTSGKEENINMKVIKRLKAILSKLTK
jgi:hypothetical protein